MTPHRTVTNVRDYASDRVFDGTRPLSPALAAKLKARHTRQPQRRVITWVASVIAVGGALAMLVRNAIPHS